MDNVMRNSSNTPVPNFDNLVEGFITNTSPDGKSKKLPNPSFEQLVDNKPVIPVNPGQNYIGSKTQNTRDSNIDRVVAEIKAIIDSVFETAQKIFQNIESRSFIAKSRNTSSEIPQNEDRYNSISRAFDEIQELIRNKYVLIGTTAVFALLVVTLLMGILLKRTPEVQPSPEVQAGAQQTAIAHVVQTQIASMSVGPNTSTQQPPLTPPSSPQPSQSVIPVDVARDTFSKETTDNKIPDDIQGNVTQRPTGFEGYFCQKDYENPALEIAPKNIEIFGDGTILSCGWKPDEMVDIAVTSPDGNTIKTQKKNDTMIAPGVAYTLEPSKETPAGNYSITFSAPSGSVVHNFQVVPPTRSGLVDLGNNQYYLHNFENNEPVRIIAYRQQGLTLSFVAWKASQVNSDGNLLIEDSIQSGFLYVIGSKSGTVSTLKFSPPELLRKQTPAQIPQTSVNCPEALPTRLVSGGRAYVDLQNPTPNLVRSLPTRNGGLAGSINPGEQLFIMMDPPVCADGYLWWHIRSQATNLEGWTAEGLNNKYYLVPMN